MAPPKYGDLGKAAKDLFGKQYNPGEAKLELNTQTSQGVGIKSNGSHDGKAINGNVEAAYALQGAKVTTKFNTAQILTTEVKFPSVGAKGLDLTLEGVYGVADGKTAAKASVEYVKDNLHTTTDVNLLAGPTVAATAVMSFDRVLVGYETGYDVQRGVIQKNNLALSFLGPDYIATAKLDNLATVNASLYNRVKPDIETGVQVTYAQGKPLGFAVGAIQRMGAGAFAKAKVDNNGQFGLSYTQNVRKDTKVTLSALIDGMNLSSNQHKVGLHVIMEP
eukprot:Clim_evm24s224 gene=Clim_evmTU24s224